MQMIQFVNYFMMKNQIIYSLNRILEIRNPIGDLRNAMYMVCNSNSR